MDSTVVWGWIVCHGQPWRAWQMSSSGPFVGIQSPTHPSETRRLIPPDHPDMDLSRVLMLVLSVY